MIRYRPAAPLCAAFTALSAVALPAHAATFIATNTSFDRIFASAGAGDLIRLSGSFGQTVLSDRSFSTPLRLDASRASFNGALIIRNMQGLAVSGGRYGGGGGTWQNAGTIRVDDSSQISFTTPRLTADGLGKARGLTFRNSSDFSVTGGSFTGFRLALGSTGSSNGLFANNVIKRATSDGINISNSHFITARGNSCSGSVPSPGAHADCIQLWSLAGNPVQSDIQLIGNTATGYTQGFTSFDPDRGGGLRISMIGNRVNTSMPQGIACYGCVDSIITDNVLTTLPGARFRTYLRVIGGSNNTVANNSIGPFPPAGGPQSSLRAAATLASDIAAAGVPEPGIWLQALTGFALLGSALRQRRALVPLQGSC